ncbi:MAG: sirohydrochlorin cobaltochelatase [Blautia sp.]|nr:sirohydrochlorin cobaltochelatase [Blautia sp.]
MENTRNQNGIGQKELLVVSFGTSFADTRAKTIGAIEDDLEKAFPEYDVRRCFTSGMILSRIKKRDDIHIDSIEEALQRAAQNGVKELLIQPTHLMKGHEYQKLLNTLEGHRDAFEKVILGTPLVTDRADLGELAEAIRVSGAAYEAPDTALVFMGHGTDAESNAIYSALQEELRARGCEDYYIGTVEGTPTISDIQEQLTGKGYKKVVLQPLMVVAGDHACNDMAGDEPDSWKSLLTEDGYEVQAVIRGLGELPEIRKLYCAHVKKALGQAG